MHEMRVHIFKDEHLYNISLLKFLEGRFDLKDHRFIFLKSKSGKTEGLFPGQVFHYPGIRGLWKAIMLAGKSRKVYFHMLPMGPQLLLWTVYPGIFTKSVWIFWGADIYAYRNRYKGLKHLIYHLCRKIIISRIPDIGGFLEKDFRIIRDVYRSKATYHYVFYPIPTDFELIDRMDAGKETEEHAVLRVLLGNSGSKTNLHLEALEMLGKFKDENIEIICPLSYGKKDEAYFREVVEKGRQLFGDRFVGLTEFMPPDQYTRLLAGIDIAIMNHNRQEALGNIISLLYLGKKVYLKPDTSSFEYFRSLNVKVFNINDLITKDYKDFSALDRREVAGNAPILKKELSVENTRKCWEQVINIK